MRKIYISLLLILGTLHLAAQTQDAKSSYSDSTKWGKDSLYIQLFAGINKSANENMPWTEFTAHPLSGGAFIGVGREWTRLWGWRMVLGIDGNKSRNVPQCESSQTWGWTDIEGWADATFDLTDAFRDKDKKPGKFNLKAFAGMGGLYTFNFPKDVPLSYTEPYSKNSTMNFGLRTGLTANYRIADQWRVGAELSHLWATDQFNGVNDNIGMDGRTNLKVGVTYFLGKKQKKQAVPQEIIAQTQRLKEAPIFPLMMFEPEGTKERKLEGRSFLDFPVNETIIYPSYRRNPEELKRIRETIDKARFDKGIEITKIELHGYASPESPYDNNTRLAKGRVAALAKYLQNYYKLKPAMFEQKYTPEDWENLRSYIADNDQSKVAAAESRRTVKQSIWYDKDNVVETPVMADVVLKYRDELLSVIDSEKDPDLKEEDLKKVGNGEPYKWLLKNVYPGLRHTDYIITYVVNSFAVSKARRLIYTHPEALSLDEMYQVAASHRRRSDEWYEAITIAAKQFPDNDTACLNAAMACVEMHRLKDAKSYLRYLTGSEADYVRDVIAAMEGTSRWKIEDGKVILLND